MMQLSTAGARAKLGRPGGDPATPCRVRFGTSYREDPNRLLQGCHSQAMSRKRGVRFPGLHIPTTTSAKPAGQELRQFPAGDQRQGGQRNPADRPRMADSLGSEQPTARRLGKADRSRGAGMDELLRAVLPHEVHRGPAPHQRGSRPMGETEVQAVAKTASVHVRRDPVADRPPAGTARAGMSGARSMRQSMTAAVRPDEGPASSDAARPTVSPFSLPTGGRDRISLQRASIGPRNRFNKLRNLGNVGLGGLAQGTFLHRLAKGPYSDVLCYDSDVLRNEN
jgi:hypothetical protein